MPITDINAPLAWRVYAVADFVKVSSGKVQPWFEQFDTAEAADKRKKELQASGHVASVKPIYASLPTRERIRKKQQWKMPSG